MLKSVVELLYLTVHKTKTENKSVAGTDSFYNQSSMLTPETVRGCLNANHEAGCVPGRGELAAFTIT